MLVSVSNLRISNKTTADLVKIVDLYPIINWEYSFVNIVNVDINESTVGTITDSETAGKYAYEILIGTSADSLGTSDFIGDIADTGIVISQSTAWRYTGPSLVRGETYYGQIRIFDEFSNDSEWETFSFQYNSLPSVITATITPESPTTTDNLMLSYEFNDSDGDVEGESQIWWYKNGIRDRQHDNKRIIDSDFLVFGDTWAAQIFPNDGYENGTAISTSAVTVSKQAPVASELYILPASPTTADPLYANYTYVSENLVNESSIRWYINNVLSSTTTQFARLELSPGDVVRFEVQPNDGEYAGEWVASSDVEISEAPLYIDNLLIDSRKEPLDLHSLVPTITWSVHSQDKIHTKIKIKIGTAPEASNVFDTEIDLPLTLYSIPEDTLQYGVDYYIAIAAGDADGFGAYTNAHFRTSGSKWVNDVSNTNGWTVEVTAKIAPSDDRPTDEEMETGEFGSVDAFYQGLRIYDGAKYAEIRLYENKLVFISETEVEKTLDFSNLVILSIVGQNSDIKIYANYQLIIDGTGQLTKSSSDKLIEFGAIGDSAYTNGEFLSFYYTVAGAFNPSASQYYNVQYETFFETDGQVDFVTGINGEGYISVSSDATNESSTVYKLLDYIKPEQIVPEPNNLLTVHKITQDASQKYTYVCHEKGFTGIKSYLIAEYDSELIFAQNNDNPEDNNYKLVKFQSEPIYTSIGMKFDTLDTNSGKAYYTQNEPGTKWFDQISNEKGWTVAFSFISAARTSDDMSATNTDAPDGTGIYINDGTFWETISFFPQEVIFIGRNLSIPIDTTVLREYVIIGKRENIKLYAKLPTDNVYALIGESRLTNRATNEGNAGRPYIVEKDGSQHCVWHDDGIGYRQIYYSLYSDGWSIPKIIAGEKYGSANPALAIDSENNIYCVFESSKSDGTDIGLVIKNRYGWSNPFTIASSPFSSLHPDITIDNDDNIHVVWEEHSTGVPSIMYIKRDATSLIWSAPLVISDYTKTCYNPVIASKENTVHVSYTQKSSDDTNDIYYTQYSSSWSSPRNISESGVAADFSTIVVSTNIHIAWHDNKNGNYEIYTRTLSGLSSSGSPLSDIIKLSIDDIPSRFPRLGVRAGADAFTNNIYLVYESGGDLSPYIFEEMDVPTSIVTVYYSDGVWYSDNTTGHSTAIMPPDNRMCRRPNIAKQFAGNAHIVYEADLTAYPDEHIPTTDVFTVIKDAIYDLSYVSSYSLVLSEVDRKISGQRFRKEIRFGDFSDARGYEFTFGYFKYYTGDAVEPFEFWLLPYDSGSIDAVPNQNGDSWTSTTDRLALYFKQTNQLAIIDSVINPTLIRFNLNKMYVLNNGDDATILVSDNHNTFETWITGKDIIDFRFDSNNHLWVATASHIIEYNENKDILSYFIISDFTATENIDTIEIRKFDIDSADVLWIVTNVGLISLRNGTGGYWDTNNSGLSDSNIYDIAIRNSSTRYLATPSGILKMSGNGFQKLHITDSDWTDHISAVLWREPNILWAAGQSKLFQIIIDESDDTYKIVTFSASQFANLNASASCMLNVDYTLSETVPDDVLVQLLVNGRVVKKGYTIKNNQLRLDAPLFPNDKLSVIIRNDIEYHSTLEQNIAEKNYFGTIERRFNKILLDGTRIYGSTVGDKQQILVHTLSDSYTLPYDKIVLDNQPPTGWLVFEKQLSENTVQLFFDEVADNLSGVDQMMISIYENFTSDGETPLEWSPFQERLEFNIGNNFGNVFTEISFDSQTGAGSRLGKLGEDILAGTSNPARIFKLDVSEQNAIFTEVFDFPDEPDDTSVEFFIPYLQSVIIGTGSPTGQAKLWQTADGVNFELLQTLDGTHALCGANLNGIIYIGTKGGPLYKYNGVQTSSTGLELGSAIYSLYGAKDALWVGAVGRVYKVITDVNFTNASQNTYTATFLHSEQDSKISAIIAANFKAVAATGTAPTDDFLVFAAGGSNGRIVKSINGNPFGPSLQTIPVNINSFKLNSSKVVHACVGKNLYKYGSSRSWEPLFTNTADLLDVEFDQTGAWVISADKIQRIKFENDKKKIYFALKDVAGNATNDPSYALAEANFEEIGIDDLLGFVNQNRILELDEFGAEIFRYTGNSPFYSANKVETERAEYYSEIFNGTTDLVSWETIYWDATVPDGTDLKVQVRSAATRDGVLASLWTKTFTKEEFEGGDITSLSGQFLQFKVIMTTETRGKTPKLYRVSVQSYTRSSVHFFSTNFILPSKIIKGILTARTVTPVAAEIVFGIDTNDSVDFSTYQIVELDRLFTLGTTQVGNNLRIGIKLISPLSVVGQTDPLIEYTEYGESLYNNIIEFTYTAEESGTYNFALSFYEDSELTELATILYSTTTPTAFSYENQPWADGVEIDQGESQNILTAVKGNAAIRCNQYYYVVLSVSKDGESFETFGDAFSFISACNPTFADEIEFPFTNSGDTGNFHFRVKFYSNPTRTDLVETFFSNTDQTNWIVDDTNIMSGGHEILSGETAIVNFIPTGLDAGIYYLSISAFNEEFELISNAYYIRITSNEDAVCGEYSNVPIVKDPVIMFELDDFVEKFGTLEKTRRTIMLNQTE